MQVACAIVSIYISGLVCLYRSAMTPQRGFYGTVLNFFTTILNFFQCTTFFPQTETHAESERTMLNLTDAKRQLLTYWNDCNAENIDFRRHGLYDYRDATNYTCYNLSHCDAVHFWLGAHQAMA